MNQKEIFEKLSQVDGDHFAIVSEHCVEIYDTNDCLATPMPKGTVAISIDAITDFKSTLAELYEAEDGNASQKETCDFILSYMQQVGLY